MSLKCLDKANYLGHRDRLRDRFLHEPNSVPDYELLEIVLFASNPRKDVKPLAKNLLKTFGGLAEIASCSSEQLTKLGLNKSAICNLRAIKEFSARIVKAEIKKRPIIQSWQSLLDYCKLTMAYNRTEQFRVLYLNSKNMLIKDVLQEVGTVNHTPIYPREIVKYALELDAAAIILVHNHPSGDPTPSKDDISITKEIVEIVDKLGIALHDHIVIAEGGFYSFKASGLI